MKLQRTAGRTRCHIVRQKCSRHGRVSIEVGHPRGSHLHLVRIGRERSLPNAGIEGRCYSRDYATRSGTVAQSEELLDCERRTLRHGLWRATCGSWSCNVNCLGPSYRVQIHCLLRYTIHWWSFWLFFLIPIFKPVSWLRYLVHSVFVVFVVYPHTVVTHNPDYTIITDGKIYGLTFISSLSHWKYSSERFSLFWIMTKHNVSIHSIFEFNTW